MPKCPLPTAALFVSALFATLLPCPTPSAFGESDGPSELDGIESVIGSLSRSSDIGSYIPSRDKRTKKTEKRSYPKNFLKALKHLKKWESGINGSLHDRGNAGGSITNMGVTQATYNAYRKRGGLRAQSVRFITEAEMREIAYSFWRRAGCNHLPPRAGTVQLEIAFMRGWHRAVKLLQNLVGAPVSGHFGRETRMAVAKYKAENLLVEMLSEHARLIDEDAKVGSNWRFAAGWNNRLKALKKLVGGPDYS